MIRADGQKCSPLIVFKGSVKGRIAKEVKTFEDEQISCCTQPNTKRLLQPLDISMNNLIKKNLRQM